MDTWAFKDYVSRRGTNEIHEWLERLPRKVRWKLRERIQVLSNGAVSFAEPYVKDLHGEAAGLLELKVVFGNVQYRPIGYRGPTSATVTLLVGAIEKGGRLSPSGVFQTAKNRILDIESDAERYTCEHLP